MPDNRARPARLNIVVADADAHVVEKIVMALREDGHAVFHAYDGLSAIQLATGFPEIHLVITNTLVIESPGIELIHQLRRRMPSLPIIYLAAARSTPEIEAELPADIPIVREPFDAAEIRRLAKEVTARKR